MCVDVLNMKVSHFIYVDISDGENILWNTLVVYQTSAHFIDCLGKEFRKLFKVSHITVDITLLHLGQSLLPVPQVFEIPCYICPGDVQSVLHTTHENLYRYVLRPCIVVASRIICNSSYPTTSLRLE